MTDGTPWNLSGQVRQDRSDAERRGVSMIRQQIKVIDEQIWRISTMLQVSGDRIRGRARLEDALALARLVERHLSVVETLLIKGAAIKSEDKGTSEGENVEGN